MKIDQVPPCPFGHAPLLLDTLAGFKALKSLLHESMTLGQLRYEQAKPRSAYSTAFSLSTNSRHRPRVAKPSERHPPDLLVFDGPMVILHLLS